ncbi:hypothetical protein A2V71_04775 [Candidatus Berkelbacteria bacterium RBG_13_40_8]|uniref:Multifunctional fusion protein n=1 Tax=Candidatus Berkelbacteria bacterium RBG_13_40_8 TaxID=1797467 RepID=A0A1F5DMX0_9BACT|nr:MAG: hypothetical protein A2V71_04775 [Candidatus Berkelbacteria bacterium RBG_13_40_8]
MSQPRIITVPNKLLREPTEKVGSFDEGIINQGKEMAEFLRQNSDNGIGLSANQLGYNNQIFVTFFDDPEKKNVIPLTFFINPQIVKKEGEVETLEEGCLSVPNMFLPVERAIKVKVRAKGLDGKNFKLTAKGLFARLIQHETDHLNGILFTDRVREKLFGKFPELKNLKIIFIGTGDFADLILEGLILLGFNIQLVITEKPKPSGREKIIADNPVGETAKLFGKKIIETDDISSLGSKISNLKSDLIILSDFGQILPGSILKMPKIAAINIHPSLLPKYRGPSPIQTAILNGEKETGVSIIKMVPKIDKGPILAQEAIEIWENDNANSLKKRLSNLSLQMLTNLLPKLQQGKATETNQDKSQVTFTRKLTKTDSEINWQKSSTEIDHQIRAFYPWPGSYTTINGKRLIIHQAHLDNGKLVLDIVQPEGKKPMKWSDFLRGFHGEKPGWFKWIDSRED